MAAITAITLGVALAGAATTGYGMYKGNKAGKAMEEATIRREKLNEQRMKLEAANQRRKATREMLAARAMSLANASAAGAQFGSGYAGGQAQIGSSYGTNMGIINQNENIGEGIFAANADIARASRDQNTAQGIMNLGKDIFASSQAIGRIGATGWGFGDSGSGYNYYGGYGKGSGGAP